MEFYSQLADLVLNIEFASFLCSSSLSSSPSFFVSGSIRILRILCPIFSVRVPAKEPLHLLSTAPIPFCVCHLSGVLYLLAYFPEY